MNGGIACGGGWYFVEDGSSMSCILVVCCEEWWHVVYNGSIFCMGESGRDVEERTMIK